LKPVSGKRLRKILEKHGWVLVRVKGSHHIFEKSGVAATINVPVHGNQTLKPGTQKSIMRTAGLTDEDL
jgi:predicted RNA binding protein YcfA (HicA-like mRNA interferase family)